MNPFMCVYEFGCFFHSALTITICILLLPCPVMDAFSYKNLNFFLDRGFSIFNSINFYQIESLHMCMWIWMLLSQCTSQFCTLLLPCSIRLPCPVMGSFPYKNLNFFMDMGFSISNSIDFYQIESFHVCIWIWMLLSQCTGHYHLYSSLIPSHVPYKSNVMAKKIITYLCQIMSGRKKIVYL